MRLKTHLSGFALVPLLVANVGEGRQLPVRPAQTPTPCEVTIPNGIAAVPEQADTASHGNKQLSVGPFGLWPNGTVVFKPGGAGFVTRDGSLGMKFGWLRGVPGQLKIEGRRLDAPAPPLRAEIPNGYEDSGFQATYLIFSTPGCWEVTARVGDASLTFVTMVVKIGDGPEWRRDSSLEDTRPCTTMASPPNLALEWTWPSSLAAEFR